MMKADHKKLKEHVKTLSEELVPRDAGHPKNMDRAADYIMDELKSFTNRTEEQSYLADHLAVRNGRAFIGPETEERIVVGAHL